MSETTAEDRTEKDRKLAENLFLRLATEEEGEAASALVSLRKAITRLGIPLHDWFSQKNGQNDESREQVEQLTDLLAQFAEANDELKANEEALLEEVRRLAKLLKYLKSKDHTQVDPNAFSNLLDFTLTGLRELQGICQPLASADHDLATFYQAQAGRTLQSNAPAPKKAPNLVAATFLFLAEKFGCPYPFEEINRLNELNQAQNTALQSAHQMGASVSELQGQLPVLLDMLDKVTGATIAPGDNDELMQIILDLQLSKTDFDEQIRAERARADNAELQIREANRQAEEAEQRAQDSEKRFGDFLEQAQNLGLEIDDPALRLAQLLLYRMEHEKNSKALESSQRENAALQDEILALKAQKADTGPDPQARAKTSQQLDQAEKIADSLAQVSSDLKEVQHQSHMSGIWQSLACGAGTTGAVFFASHLVLGTSNAVVAIIAAVIGGGVAAKLVNSAQKETMSEIVDPFNKTSNGANALSKTFGETLSAMSWVKQSTSEQDRAHFMEEATALRDELLRREKELLEREKALTAREFANAQTLAEIAAAKAQTGKARGRTATATP